MIIVILKILLWGYFLGLLLLLIHRASLVAENKKGVLAVILFPLMLLTEKGRKTLKKGKINE